MFTGGGGGARGGAAAPPRPASINHVCMNMASFNVDAILEDAGRRTASARAATTLPPVRPAR